MRRLETQPLAGFNDTPIDLPAKFDVRVGGRDISYDELIGNTPAVTSTYDGLADPQLVLGTEAGLPIWDEERYYPVGRFATFHGRSVDVLADKILISDQHDNDFSSINIKGVDLSEPEWIESQTASRDYIVRGLQESLVMERVLRASRILRQNNIRTEYIFGLVLPESFPGGQSITYLDDKEPVELAKLLDTLSTEFADSEKEGEKSPLELKVEMLERFADCDYLISYRAIDCPYRFGEMGHAERFEAFKEFMQKKCTNLKDKQYFKNMDKYEYPQTVFAPFTGRNMGKLHKLGLVHKFPTAHNLTATGSLIDLDSCEGPPLALGDKEPAKEDIINDISLVLNNIDKYYWGLASDDSSMSERGKVIDGSFWASVIFLHEYINERFETKDEKTEFLADLLVQSQDWEKFFTDSRKRMHLAKEILAAYAVVKDGKRKLDPSFLEADFSWPTHSSGFLYALPPAYYKDMSVKLAERDWSVNEKLAEQGEAVDRRVLHPMSMTIDSIVLEVLTKPYRGENAQKINDPSNFLYTLGCACGGIIPRVKDKVAATKIFNRFSGHRETVVDHFRASRYRSREGEDHNPVSEERNNYIGAVRFDREGDIFVPIVYLKDDEDYCSTLEKISDYENVKYVYGTQEMIDELRESSKSILLADATQLQKLSEHSTNTGFITSLVNSLDNQDGKPLMIFNLEDNSPTVSVYGDLHLDGKQLSYQEVLKIMCPSKITPVQKKLDL